MLINEIISHELNEGPNDPHIFKAVFLAGGPGSGKSYVASKLLNNADYGLKTVNSDDMFEFLMKQNDMKPTPDNIYSPDGQALRGRAKTLTKNRENTLLDGRLGVIIDGTGKDTRRIAIAQNRLKELGYDTMMLFVNTSLEVAQQRNQQRDRTLPADKVNSMWRIVQNNLMRFQQLFGAGNFHIVDNSGGLEDPDRKENFEQVEKAIRAFLSQPPSSRIAKQWIAAQAKSDK
jgi:predicted kinase